MITYQDLVAVGKNDNDRIEFVRNLIEKHKQSEMYTKAVNGQNYSTGRNTAIMNFVKFIYEATGEKIEDIWSANYKLPSNFLHRVVTQKVQYSLGNGINWKNENTESKIGTKKYPFYKATVDIATAASLAGVAFGFFNNDHVRVFTPLDFAPLYDEEDGALKSGVRFWQIAADKPLRADLYELDGVTSMMWKDGEGKIIAPKRPYKRKINTSEIFGAEIYGGENYKNFPIVPMWGNSRKISDLDEIIQLINAYDFTISGFANTVEEASFIIWTFQNAGGMVGDEVSVQEVMDSIRRLHAVAVDDNVVAQPNTLQAPFEAREQLLERLEKDIYSQAMAVDTKHIASGNATAKEITASYELLNAKCDDFETCVTEWINGILEIAGIDDAPTFERSKAIDTEERVQTLLQAAPYLPEEYVTEKLLTLFGDIDRLDEIKRQIALESIQRAAEGYGKSKTENYAGENNNAQSGAEGE